MLKRRDSGSAGQDEGSAQSTEAKQERKQAPKYSVSVYIIMMFAVVMVLIVLSYFVQQRSSSQTISDITEQHDRFSIQALQNIEELQKRNMSLMERIEQLEIELSQTKEELEDTQEEYKNEYGAAEQSLQAVKLLLNAYLAAESGDDGAAREYLLQLGAIPGGPGEEYAAALEALRERVT